MSLTESAGYHLSDSEQCCYRTLDVIKTRLCVSCRTDRGSGDSCSCPRPVCGVGGRGMNVCGHCGNVMILTGENGVLGQRNSLVLNFSTTNLMQVSLVLKEGLRSERPATV
jgi:hypothetical protein